MRSHPPSPSGRLWLALALASSLLCLAACESHPRRGRGAMVDMPRINLNGSGDYFNGQLLATASVRNGLARGPMAEGGSGHEGGGAMGEGGMGRHGGGMRGMGGGDMDGDEMGGGMRGMHGGGGGEYRERGEGGGGMGRLGSHEPPLTLRVRLENRGKENLTVEIRDVQSDLGNFVPEPDHVLLAPGQSVELEPMISRLGVVSGDIPLQLVLRANGKVEDQTIHLKSAAPAAPPAQP